MLAAESCHRQEVEAVLMEAPKDLEDQDVQEDLEAEQVLEEVERALDHLEHRHQPLCLQSDC
jgi:hypothetical protein